MADKNSSNPVERANAELEDLMTEFNDLIGQGKKTDEPAGEDPSGDPPKDAAPDPEPKDQTADPEPPAGDGNDDSYKQRWESLKGIVKSKDSQIATLQEQVNQLIAQNAQAMEQIQNQSAPSKPDANTADTSAENLMQIASTLGDQYGEEIGGFLTKIAQHVQKLEDAGQNFGTELAHVKSTVTVNRAEVELTKLCPTWREVDTDQGFITWLQRTAPYSEKEMIDVLNEKWGQGDVKTVAAIFNEYIGSKRQPSTDPPAKDPREALVTPGSRGASNPTNPVPDKNAKIYTEAEANQFFRDVQTGKYRGREADAKKIENDITLAYLEGRVR